MQITEKYWDSKTESVKSIVASQPKTIEIRSWNPIKDCQTSLQSSKKNNANELICISKYANLINRSLALPWQWSLYFIG